NARAVSALHIKALKKFIKADHHDYIRPYAQLEGILDIEPRDHGKSTRMSQAFPLWLALTKSKVFPVIAGASKEKATDFLDYIKFEIENNDRIREDFGELKGAIWKKNKITLRNGNAIAAIGAGEAIRGLKDKATRPTHIICDDLLKDKEVESKTSREHLYKWFKRVIMNLGKGALIVIVNTIMHPDDLPSRLLAEIKEGSKLKGWIGLRFSAITPEGKPLWPQRWSLKDIEKKRIDLGSHIFATEWENEPMPDEEKKFRKDWFRTFKLTELDWHGLTRVMAVDPATGKSAGDDSAVVVVGKSESQMLSVLEAKGEKISDMKLIDLIIDQFLIWKPKHIVFETVMFQEIYKNQLLREALRRGVVLPIVCVKHTINKEFRIGKLSPLVEAGILTFREGLNRCLEQFETFPKGHDDIPDAVEMAVSKLITKNTPAPSVHSLGVKRESFRVLGRYGNA
ncbi:MAG: phage terminase large subunit, partial [Nitrospirota bacterium]